MSMCVAFRIWDLGRSKLLVILLGRKLQLLRRMSFLLKYGAMLYWGLLYNSLTGDTMWIACLKHLQIFQITIYGVCTWQEQETKLQYSRMSER